MCCVSVTSVLEILHYSDTCQLIGWKAFNFIVNFQDIPNCKFINKEDNKRTNDLDKAIDSPF